MDVAITGMGIISSIGQDPETFHANLAADRKKIGRTQWANEPEFENVWVSWIDDFEPGRWMTPQVVAGTDRFGQYAIAAAVQAVRAAGFEAPPDPLRTAVVLGTAFAGVETITDSQRGFDSIGVEGISRKLNIQVWPNMAAAQIAIRWQLHGPLLTVCHACASSVDSVGLAARMIASGQADYAIACGAEGARSRMFVLAAARYGMFTPQPDPERACCPFDVDRIGVIAGDGAGALFLEPADRARARGASIHGIIRGYASLSDGYHMSSPEPNGEWEARTMQMAIDEAALPNGANDIDAVIAHATATPVGDIAEIRAINRVFGAHAEKMRVTSLKGHIGHTAGASGVMGIIAGLGSMAHGALVPTAGTRTVEPEARFHVPLRKPAPGPINGFQVNAFGFGGQNASLVVTRS
jgi:3-oxoacyl-[acyl-carrier-protein] synthase II